MKTNIEPKIDGTIWFSFTVSSMKQTVLSKDVTIPKNTITHIIKCIAICSSSLICNYTIIMLHFNDVERKIVR